jgi:hypothetical protein
MLWLSMKNWLRLYMVSMASADMWWLTLNRESVLPLQTQVLEYW